MIPDNSSLGHFYITSLSFQVQDSVVALEDSTSPASWKKIGLMAEGEAAEGEALGQQ